VGGGEAAGKPRERGRADIDPLTTLGTRAAVLRALEQVGSGAKPPALLAVVSLDGFEEYEALFGRLAGRTLIVELAASLAGALGPYGSCFRPRRDEFAALLESTLENAAPVLDAAVAGLGARAGSVAIYAAWGAVALPAEAADPGSALRVADGQLATGAFRRPRERRVAPPRVA